MKQTTIEDCLNQSAFLHPATSKIKLEFVQSAVPIATYAATIQFA